MSFWDYEMDALDYEDYHTYHSQEPRVRMTQFIWRRGEMPNITGNCKWASIQKPNTKFEPVWTIDIIVDEATKGRLEAVGLKTKKDKDGDTIFKIKRKVNKKDGSENSPPEVLDAEGNPFTRLVGNGSKVKVNFSPYDWESFGSSGKNAWLNSVTVLEHVPFEEEDDTDFAEEASTKTSQKPAKANGEFDDDIPF